MDVLFGGGGFRKVFREEELDLEGVGWIHRPWFGEEGTSQVAKIAK